VNDTDIFGSLFCVVGIGVLIGIVFALVYLMKQAKQEEIAAKLEMQQLVRSLPRDSQAAFMIQYNGQKKTPSTAVILALLLGGIGVHKFYLGKTGMGILYLLFCWTGIPGIIAFFEAFTITRTVRRLNREVARETAAMFGGDLGTPASVL